LSDLPVPGGWVRLHGGCRLSDWCGFAAMKEDLDTLSCFVFIPS
jgi:hypothetical protein